MMSRVKELEDENRRLKKMYAEECLKYEICSRTPSKKRGKSISTKEGGISQTCYRYHSRLNHERPNMAIGGITPAMKLASFTFNSDY